MSQDMAAFFDELAPKWDSAPSEYEKREKLTSLMNLLQNTIIADVGCGKGVMLEHLLKTNPAKIIAVDISGEMIRLAKEINNNNRVEFIHGDFLNTTLPMLDTAIFFNSYPHFLDKQALAEKLSKVVRKDGTMIIAHSLSKAKINGTHKGKSVSKLSMSLESAEIEAKAFQKFFTTDTLIDNDEMYFIKMTRK